MADLTLRNQSTDGVDSAYFSTLKNAVIDMIMNDIPATLTFL